MYNSIIFHDEIPTWLIHLTQARHRRGTALPACHRVHPHPSCSSATPGPLPILGGSPENPPVVDHFPRKTRGFFTSILVYLMGN